MQTRTTGLSLTGLLVVATAIVALRSPSSMAMETVVEGLQQPFAVGLDGAGKLYIAEMTGQKIVVREPGGSVRTFAGTGVKGYAGDGGPASAAQFNGVHHILVTTGGDVCVADTWNNRVRKIDGRTGVITTIAGTGRKGFSGDGGPATAAEFGAIYCLAMDAAGTSLYLADLDNLRVRRIDLKTGIVTTVAGNGQQGVPTDGAPATQSPLVDPRAVAVDSTGHLYIVERSGHALRVVSPDGRIKTIAGTGKPGPCGEGGPALATAMNGPKHLCTEPDGSILIADTENHAVLRYLPRDGRIVRVGADLDLKRPHGVFVHAHDLYIADSDHGRVLRIHGDKHAR